MVVPPSQLTLLCFLCPLQACQLLGMQTAQFRDCDLASLNAAFTKRVTITKKDESKLESPDSDILKEMGVLNLASNFQMIGTTTTSVPRR